MTAAPQQCSGVEVTQADREAAAACARYFEHGFTSDEILSGEADMCSLVAIVRNHRLSAFLDPPLQPKPSTTPARSS